MLTGIEDYRRPGGRCRRWRCESSASWLAMSEDRELTDASRPSAVSLADRLTGGIGLRSDSDLVILPASRPAACLRADTEESWQPSRTR
jgi:hypothetical protein